ncbi:hypothetical protein ACFRCG_07290 [Embleya sp. NPDC056575]|uniref:hypothetical protein n=1 Tax=unclassified Embleya TaxID=2699296 RepID=UPI0036B3A9B4
MSPSMSGLLGRRLRQARSVHGRVAGSAVTNVWTSSAGVLNTTRWARTRRRFADVDYTPTAVYTWVARMWWGPPDPVSRARPLPAEVFVGDFEARCVD